MIVGVKPPYKKLSLLLVAVITLVTASTTSAAIALFDLKGKAGFGLLGGNENPAVAGGGVGGEVGSGISFDDVTKILALNVGWGIADGFSTNLTGNSTAMHIHNSSGFTENRGVQIGLNSLAGYSNLANGGGFNGTVTLTPTQEGFLNAGTLYINVHTAANPGGEIRGNVVAVPEPATAVFGVLGLLLVAILLRRPTA